MFRSSPLLGILIWMCVAAAVFSGPTLHDDTYESAEIHALNDVVQLLVRLNWTYLAIISDDDDLVNWLMSKLTMSSMQLELKVLPSFSKGTQNESAPDMGRVWNVVKSGNILAAGSERMQRETIGQMTFLSAKSTRISRLVLDTRWLLLVSSHVMATENLSSLQVNNLAFVVYSTEKADVSVKTLVWTGETLRSAVAADVIRTQPNAYSSLKHRTPSLREGVRCFSGLCETNEDLQAKLYPNSQYGLNGISLRVGILTWPKYVTSHYNNVTNETFYSGLCLDLLNILAQSLNFTYELVLPPDREWGVYRNGSWTGLVGLLHNGQIEVSVAPLTPTPERGTVVDWTVPFDYSYMAIVARNDGVDLYRWTAFLSLFTWKVYLCIAVTFMWCLIVLLGLMAVERRLAPFIESRQAEKYTGCLHRSATHERSGPREVPSAQKAIRPTSARWPFAQCVTSVAEKNDNAANTCAHDAQIHAHRQKGLQSPPSCLVVLKYMYLAGETLLGESIPGLWVRGSSRALIACWCLLSLVLMSCYASNLTSLLVSVPSPPPFTSLAEMVRRTDFRWGTIGGSSLLTDIRRSQNSVHKAVYEKMMTFAKEDPDVLNFDPEVHLAKVLKGRYAFISSALVLEGWASEHCDVTVLPAGISGLRPVTIFSPLRSVLSRRIDTVLRRLQDAGVMSYLRERWLPRTNGCRGNRSSTTSITIATLQGPIYVASGGLLLASVVVLAERLVCIAGRLG